MIEIKSEKKLYSVNFPTNVKEITPSILDKVLSCVNLPKYHCVVAVCTTIKLFDLATLNESSAKNTLTKVTPLLAKINNDDNKDLNGAIGDKVVIDRSSLERGVHLYTPLSISMNNAIKYIHSDKKLISEIINGRFNNSNSIGTMNKHLVASNSPEITLVEFKIVPVSMISATITNDTNEDPFIRYADESC